MAEPRIVNQLPRTFAVIEEGIQNGLHLGGQLYVSLRGEAVTDEAFGESRPGRTMRRDDLMLWLSSTKPFTAVAIAQLRDRGKLALDDRVAKYIPEFAAGGKDAITIRHLLTHTAGFRGPMNNFAGRTWDEMIAWACALKLEPGWVPGEKAGYHTATSWFILGEIVRRLDGRSFDVYAREEIFLPLGMNDSWIGMPRERFENYGERIAPMFDLDKREELDMNSIEASTLPRPGANGRGPIRELGKFYETLLAGGGKILSADTVREFTQRQRIGMFDHTFKHIMDWGLGFMVNSNRYGFDTVPYNFGPHASEETFGHSGHQSSTAFADPRHMLVVAIAFNGLPGEEKHDARMRKVLAAIYEDLELVT